MDGIEGPGNPRAAVNDSAVMARWKECDRQFKRALRHHMPPEVHAEDRQSFVVLSAPHGGRQHRNGGMKLSDAGTGALVSALAELEGLSYIAVDGEQPDDPNWDRHEGRYKRTLHSVLGRDRHFVIDVHSMKFHRRPDICIGFSSYPSPRAQAVAYRWREIAHELGLTCTFNDPFSARHKGTVTNFVQSLHRDALQIEVNTRFMIPHGPHADTIVRFFRAAVAEADQSQNY